MSIILLVKAQTNVPRRQLRSIRHQPRRLNLHLAEEVAAAQSSGEDYLGVCVVLLPSPSLSLSPIPVPDRHHDLGLPCFTGQVVAVARQIPMLAPQQEACQAHHDFISPVVDYRNTLLNLKAEEVHHNTRRNSLLRRLTCKVGIILKRHRHLFQHSICTRLVPLRL